MDRRMMVDPSEWKWFGNAGHLICGQWCRFHMATQVGPWLVSTVGEYVHPSHSSGAEFLKDHPLGEEIGWDRLFETMVFRAGEPCAGSCGCGIPGISGEEVDMEGYNDRKSATDGHMAMCKKWAATPAPPADIGGEWSASDE